MADLKTVWVTKYTLSTGFISRVDDVEVDEKYAHKGNGRDSLFVGRSEFFETEEAARVAVLRRIDAKRRSVAKQLKRLSELELDMRNPAASTVVVDGWPPPSKSKGT